MATAERLTNEELSHLLVRCAERDEAAWERVFNGLYGLVKTIVLQAHLQDEDVDDAVADAFRNVVDSVQDVAEAQNPLGYIGAIARNAANGVRRKAGRRGAFEMAVEDEALELANAADKHAPAHMGQEMRVMAGQINKELEKLQKSMSDEEQRLLRLKYVDDLTYEEVAYILGRESGAIRVAVHRLVKRLKDEVASDTRQALQETPELLHQLRGLSLAAPDGGDADPRIIELLEEYVDEEAAMKPEDRAEIEAALQASSSLRERKVRLERQLVSGFDVMGHCEIEPMPKPLMNQLMQRVRGGND